MNFMSLFLLPLNNLLKFISKLNEEIAIFYPTLENSKTHLVRFDKDKEFKPNFTKIRTAENIKHFFFPVRSAVAKFPEDLTRSPKKCCLFGVKACDLTGIDIYDRVFLNWPPEDPLYKGTRENTIIISADCPEPESSCFCNLVGVAPYGEKVCDINFTVLSSGLLLEIFTKKGETIIKTMNGLLKELSPGELKEREKIRKEAVKKLQKANEKPLKTDLPMCIEKTDKKTIHCMRNECIECFSCLYACPTCYCFLLCDYKRNEGISRIRNWDACYYSAFARVGGGANPRSKMDERFWNRFQCKFNFFTQYEKIYACSGCGRCYLGCSAKIDIREILWKL